MRERSPAFLLLVIVFSQFAGTSLWFAGNAIVGDILQHTSITTGSANITSVIQFGFIAGTLVFSLLTVADKFPAPAVFFFSALLAATANICILWLGKNISWLYTLRFVTGFFLAGIYPVGMKIAADTFPNKLGNALGFLVGALVLGTAFPHVIKSLLQSLQWQPVIITTSVLALAGGSLILLFIPKGKVNSKSSTLHFKAAFTSFNSTNFRAAAYGYFGHMWELYTFWAFVPIILHTYNKLQHVALPVSLLSFIIIAMGALGCVFGGIISGIKGSKKVAFYSLLISAICCAASLLLFRLPSWLFMIYLLTWGITVVADSPQFSTMVANAAPGESKGTALTIVTCVGFAITVISMQVIKAAFAAYEEGGLLLLLVGPLLGLYNLRKYTPIIKTRK